MRKSEVCRCGFSKGKHHRPWLDQSSCNLQQTHLYQHYKFHAIVSVQQIFNPLSQPLNCHGQDLRPPPILASYKQNTQPKIIIHKNTLSRTNQLPLRKKDLQHSKSKHPNVFFLPKTKSLKLKNGINKEQHNMICMGKSDKSNSTLIPTNNTKETKT
jgi:hypothetical protein